MATIFHPSIIEDKIYDILDSDIDYIVSSDEYTPEAIAAVTSFVARVTNSCNILETPYPDETGADVSIYWTERGVLHSVNLKYRKIEED